MARGDGVPHAVDRHVGRRMAERRIGLGLNQTDLARALGITFQQVQKYESGANRISASKLWDAAAFLGVEVGHFFAGLDGWTPEPALRDAEPAPRPTRYTVEISRLVPTLSTQKQRLALEILQSMTSRDS